MKKIIICIFSLIVVVVAITVKGEEAAPQQNATKIGDRQNIKQTAITLDSYSFAQ